MSKAVRGHWSIESMHWHLDVTFREDENTTIDRTAAQNHNIMRKWCLSVFRVALPLYLETEVLQGQPIAVVE